MEYSRFIVFAYWLLDILIFILILFGKRLGAVMLLVETILLLIFHNMDSRSLYGALFAIIGEHTMSFFR